MEHSVEESTRILTEPVVDLALALQHGLTEEEYGMILKVLGRVPTYTELGMYSVMWSEHCSYKNSIALLKTFPRSGGRLLVGAGEENAGLVDIGNGFAVAFKIESHNHPSAVEPYQGAATGVGGIMRDIFTMGARPIASLNSLRFGRIDNERTKYLVKGIVKGIGDYGNSFGVPTVAGEVYFDACYQENPLVNAMSVGIVRHEQWASATAKGSGNPVMIVGSATGRDGIHGATFASEEISEESESRRPSVQVGDPFTEKLLLEATLEAIRSGYVVGIQDMGAAGITCSTSEMSAKGKCGMVIDLDRVPARETGMTAYEMMLSESQERMLVVASRGHEDDLRKIFSRWDLHAEIIGNVTDGERLRVIHQGRTVADVPCQSLVLGGGAPVYARDARVPAYMDGLRAFDASGLPVPSSMGGTLLRLLSSPTVASKRWVFQQYDQMVRTNNIVLSRADAAVVFIKEAGKALVLKADCNARYVYLNAFVGGQIAVAESARNVVCAGGEPLAITNCLNFGNPYDPEIYWQFSEAVRGIGAACRTLNTPVTGGNVSFYNEGSGKPIYPTPVIGMLGLIDDLRCITTADFKDEGDRIFLIGQSRGHVGASEYLAFVHGTVAGDCPPIDLEYEKRVQQLCLTAIRKGIVKSAHDCSEGGLGVAIAESCILNEEAPKGAHVKLKDPGIRDDFLLFGEDQSRIIVTVDPEHAREFSKLSSTLGIEVSEIGVVSGTALVAEGMVEVSCEKMAEAYYTALSSALNS